MDVTWDAAKAQSNIAKHGGDIRTSSDSVVNLGNGTFTNISINLPGVLQGAVAWGDFDSDGRLDILLTGNSNTGAVCQVWKNLGAGSFSNVNVSLPAIHQSAVALADFDNDGRLDIVMAGVDTNTNLLCEVWRNTGNWVFTNLNAGLPGIRFGSVAWADLDTDGKLDLVLTGLDAGGNPLLRVYHNNTAISSTSAPRIKFIKTLVNGGVVCKYVLSVDKRCHDFFREALQRSSHRRHFFKALFLK